MFRIEKPAFLGLGIASAYAAMILVNALANIVPINGITTGAVSTVLQPLRTDRTHLLGLGRHLSVARRLRRSRVFLRFSSAGRRERQPASRQDQRLHPHSLSRQRTVDLRGITASFCFRF
ncbi:MAG: hypothetical protein MZU97_06555 [Bacillus subtilis]|nr:hypothetical protein [Bacillus subtilis]